MRHAMPHPADSLRGTGNAILFATDRYGMRSHASWGSQEDVMLVFMNQDAYDKFRLSKEDYELQKELEKEQKKESEKDADSKDKKKKETATRKSRTKSRRWSLNWMVSRIVSCV